MQARDVGGSSSAKFGNTGAWIWSPALDLSVFGGSAVLAVTLCALNHLFDWNTEPFPEWAWVVLVLGIDVTHVYSTLYRTYFDGVELEAHPFRYFGIPALLYVTGVGLHQLGSAVFWSVLAYFAVWHFVRQQLGWVRVYRASAGTSSRLDIWVDEVAIYAATLVPVLVWHTRLDRTHFHWFLKGDFVNAKAWLEPLLPFAWGGWTLALSAFLMRQLWLYSKHRKLNVGKSVLVLSTALLWWLGIVATNSDFDFTVTNVIAHGVPYMCLLWVYARAQQSLALVNLGSRLIALGVVGFLAVPLACAFVEEFAWDRWLSHEHGWLFGYSSGALPSGTLSLLVPLLGLPQATHYALDALLWRRGESLSNPAQRHALGMGRRNV